MAAASGRRAAVPLPPGPTPEQQAMDAFLREMDSGKRGSIAVFLGAGASKPFGYPVTR
jgi:hypothetical protein